MKNLKSSDESGELDVAMKNYFDEVNRILKENPDFLKSKPNTPARRMSVRQALESERPLENIDIEMGDKKVQKIFSLLFAAIAEVNSAGAGILFDRYSSKEIKTIYDNYKKSGAQTFCEGIDAIKAFAAKKLGAAYSKKDFDELTETEEYVKIDKSITLQSEKMTEEMERALLAFARNNIHALENE